MQLHQYANDIQVYVHVTISNTTSAVQNCAACICEVNDWMRASRLRLNQAKTKIMWLGSPQKLRQVDVLDIPILSTKVKVVESARDLEVIFDNQLSLSTHITAFADLDISNFDNCV